MQLTFDENSTSDMEKKNGNIEYTLSCIGDLLLQIERCNERIQLLNSYKEPELEQSILNAKALRRQFLQQMDELLAGYGIEVRGRATAAGGWVLIKTFLRILPSSESCFNGEKWLSGGWQI